MIYCVIAAFVIQSAMHICVSHIHKKQWLEYIESKEAGWCVERQQLIDRIQAPSFAEFKHAEVKAIKAQSGEKEPPKLEQL